MIKVPEELASTAVLCEPMSVVQKAIDHVMHIQKDRLPDWHNLETCFERKRVLIAGIGAIGLLAAIAFILRGACVWGYDIVEPHSIRPQIFKQLGGEYICAKEMKVEDIPQKVDHLDVIFEAAGNTKLCFDLLSALGTNGAYVITGITEKDKKLELDAGNAFRNLVLKNQVVIGSVNAHHIHWERAITDLSLAKQKWGNLIDSLITQEYAAQDFNRPFFARDQKEIKTVIEWNNETPQL